MIKIYNTLTSRVEEFKTIEENKVKMYVCGPTVYNDSHIGNSRPVVFFDVVSRFFKYMGYEVLYVSNFTDIDDRIIERAKETNASELEIANDYIEAFIKLRDDLNAEPHYQNPRVTEHIDEIISFIEVLIDNGAAYESAGDVYFDVTKAREYGILSGQTLDNLYNNARLLPNDKKKNPVDFTLWKETTEGQNWPSPWSDGRPGWHTECVVMIDKIFGDKIDIHGGGVDLIFPHHDNEIAQASCVHDHYIANYWMHNGRIDMVGEKMSKSLGNVIWTKDLLSKYPYQAFRFMLLNVPYRQPLLYTDELINQANTEYEKIKRAYVSLYRKLELEYNITDFNVQIKDQELLSLKQNFINEMSNDFNTPNAITIILNLVKKVNHLVRHSNDQVIMTEALYLLDELLGVLGIGIDISPLSDEDKGLVFKWQELRKQKNFTEADKLRDEISTRGIEL